MMDDKTLFFIFDQCKEKGKFVYETTSLFGDSLTVNELEYWSVYGMIVSAKILDVDIEELTFDEALGKIQRAKLERERKVKSYGQRR